MTVFQNIRKQNTATNVWTIYELSNNQEIVTKFAIYHLESIYQLYLEMIVAITTNIYQLHY